MLQCESISKQDMSCSEELQSCQSEILELRRTVNALEVELQAQHTLVSPSVRLADPAWLPRPRALPGQDVPPLNTDQDTAQTLTFSQMWRLRA